MHNFYNEFQMNKYHNIAIFPIWSILKHTCICVYFFFLSFSIIFHIVFKLRYYFLIHYIFSLLDSSFLYNFTWWYRVIKSNLVFFSDSTLKTSYSDIETLKARISSFTQQNPGTCCRTFLFLNFSTSIDVYNWRNFKSPSLNMTNNYSIEILVFHHLTGKLHTFVYVRSIRCQS